MLALDGALDETVEAVVQNDIPTAALGPGAHTFNLRVKDIENNWSPLFKTVLDTTRPRGPGDIPRTAIRNAEYFWDADPGEGNGTPILAEDGAFDETVETLLQEAIPTAVLGTGTHRFNVRVMDANSVWGPAFTTLVDVAQPTPPGAIRDTKLVEAEFFWDVDPGNGNGTPLLALDGALDETVEAILQNGIALPAGIGPHPFHVRVKDAEDVWSTVFRTIVDVRARAALPEMNLVQAEYFWDTDPGQGNGTPMLALDGALDETVETFFRDGIAVPPNFGAHTFNVRTHDVTGNWSPVFTTIVYHTLNPLNLFRDPDADSLDNLTEYFLGTRPLIPDPPGAHLLGGSAEELALGPGQRLFYQVNRNHVAPDIAVEAQISENLVDWFNELDGNLVTWIDSPSQLLYYAVRSVDVAAPQFFRLKLDYVPLP